MAKDKDTSTEKEDKKAVEDAAKKTQARKTTKRIAGIVVILLLAVAYSPNLSPPTFSRGDSIDPRDVGVVHLTTNYPEYPIETEPDEYVHIQTVDDVDLERADNGIVVKQIFANNGGSKNLAPGIQIGLRTNITYRIIGGTVQTTDMYYVKCRSARPPRGWYKAALENQ